MYIDDPSLLRELRESLRVFFSEQQQGDVYGQSSAESSNPADSLDPDALALSSRITLSSS